MPSFRKRIESLKKKARNLEKQVLGTKSERKKRRKERRERARDFYFRNGLRIPARLLTKDEAFVRNASKNLTRNDIVVDLGAHVGMAAVQFSHRAGKVYALEPHPVIFKELEKASRHFPRIVPLNAAAAAEDGTAELFSDDDPRPWKHTEGSTLSSGKSNLSYTQFFTVETVDIARFISELGQPVRMIKMDVEGFEYQLINRLLDADVMDRIEMVHVEDHCDRVEGLPEQRDATLARIEAAGLSHKFDFEWP